MDEATNPITTASNPRVGEDWVLVPRAVVTEAADGLSAFTGDATSQTQMKLRAALASAPSPEAGAGGDLGELERLSAAATQGEWKLSGQFMSGDWIISTPERVIANCRPWSMRADDERHHADAAFIVAAVAYVRDLVASRQETGSADEITDEAIQAALKAYHETHDTANVDDEPEDLDHAAMEAALYEADKARSGKLVASTGSGEETKGACLTGYAEFTPISVRSSTGAPASPSGHSRAEPAGGLGASPECPSRIHPWTLERIMTAFWDVSNAVGRMDAREGSRVSDNRLVTTDACLAVGSLRTLLVQVPRLLEAVRVSDEHSQSEDPKGLSPKDASAARRETPEATPKSSPDQIPVDPPMTVEEARELLDNLPAGIEPENWIMLLRARAANVETYPFISAQLRAQVSRIEAALRTLQAGGEVRDA